MWTGLFCDGERYGFHCPLQLWRSCHRLKGGDRFSEVNTLNSWCQIITSIDKMVRCLGLFMKAELSLAYVFWDKSAYYTDLDYEWYLSPPPALRHSQFCSSLRFTEILYLCLPKYVLGLEEDKEGSAGLLEVAEEELHCLCVITSHWHPHNCRHVRRLSASRKTQVLRLQIAGCLPHVTVCPKLCRITTLFHNCA